MELKTIAVGEAWGPHRIMINHDWFTQADWDGGQTMSVAKWTHKCVFKAFRRPAPGLIRIVVGQAWGPHRAMINHHRFTQEQWDAGQCMSVGGWSHRCEFWAFPSPAPGTIRIVVGQASDPHRCMLNLDWFTQKEWDAGQSMTVAGWTHMFDFWVFPFDCASPGACATGTPPTGSTVTPV